MFEVKLKVHLNEKLDEIQYTSESDDNRFTDSRKSLVRLANWRPDITRWSQQVPSMQYISNSDFNNGICFEFADNADDTNLHRANHQSAGWPTYNPGWLPIAYE